MKDIIIKLVKGEQITDNELRNEKSMNDLLFKLIKGEQITDDDIKNELYEICDRTHASCDYRCPVYGINGNEIPCDNSDNCRCFKDGGKMLDFIKPKSNKVVQKSNTMRLGSQTGSLINHMMSNNNKLPEVGKGATVLLWSDRHAYQVVEVSKDYKKCIIKKCRAKRIDNLGLTDSGQQYDYSELEDWSKELVFRQGCWREIFKTVLYISDTSEISSDHFDENGDLKLIDGITKIVTSYPSVNIVFGIQEEYCDPSF